MIDEAHLICADAGGGQAGVFARDIKKKFTSVTHVWGVTATPFTTSLCGDDVRKLFKSVWRLDNNASRSVIRHLSHTATLAALKRFVLRSGQVYFA